MTARSREDVVRAHVRGLEPVVHGSVGAAELARFGLTPATVLDFSVNTNPLGTAPSVLRAVRETDWSRYPGDDEAPLRHALAERAGVSPSGVALGNGSVELLWSVALAMLEPDDLVAVVGPTFGEYAHAARAVGARVSEVHSLVDLPAAARVAFVCNPNNPTGALTDRSAIERALADHSDQLLVLDEAYASLMVDHWRSEPLLERYRHLAILRSLTKDHALPGLRLGYLLAAPPIARAAEAVRPPWSVNAGALRAGLASLEPAAEAHLAQARTLVAEARRLLTEGLLAMGYSVSPSSANFVLVHVGDGGAFRRALLPHGCVVRDCASFGLPGHVRIACRLPAECARLLEAIRDIGFSPEASV